MRVQSVIDMEWGSGSGRRREEGEYSQNAARAIFKENILIL